MTQKNITPKDRAQISEILDRRANEIAKFADTYRRDVGHLGSVEFALTREIDRLRRLSDRINPPQPEEDD